MQREGYYELFYTKPYARVLLIQLLQQKTILNLNYVNRVSLLTRSVTLTPFYIPEFPIVVFLCTRVTFLM